MFEVFFSDLGVHTVINPSVRLFLKKPLYPIHLLGTGSKDTFSLRQHKNFRSTKIYFVEFFLQSFVVLFYPSVRLSGCLFLLLLSCVVHFPSVSSVSGLSGDPLSNVSQSKYV